MPGLTASSGLLPGFHWGEFHGFRLIGMAMTEITPDMAERNPLKYSTSSIGDALEVLSRTLNGIHDSIEAAKDDVFTACMERGNHGISA